MEKEGSKPRRLASKHKPEPSEVTETLMMSMSTRRGRSRDHGFSPASISVNSLIPQLAYPSNLKLQVEYPPRTYQKILILSNVTSPQNRMENRCTQQCCKLPASDPQVQNHSTDPVNSFDWRVQDLSGQHESGPRLHV